MILVTEFMDEDWIAWLRARGEVRVAPELADRPADLAVAARAARALIVRNRTQVRGDVLDAGIAVVGRLGVGLDNIDVAGCEARGIRVIPATGANTLAVAEYVVTTAAMLLRGAYAMRPEMEAGDWPRAEAGRGREVAGKTLGLVGYGAIAREVERLARPFGFEVVAHDPHCRDWGAMRTVTLDALLAGSDVVSVHVPLTDETRGLIGAEAIGSMKDDAVLVNAARGGVVDEAAVAGALRAGTLGGAALDCFEHEPLGPSHPFAGCPNLVLTPHIAGVTREANARVSEMIARAVAGALGW
ncbi:hydroxyacid dehydrogenase [Jannaschia sp. W003]|uniref:hydroxyacid dehydrogenase n=1 Tax=Jannaschia sp. W003 TaxID=2867012 RepID=UPI0021A3B45F|nr:hydroxyacid dehydrogenase [Jannaschia sp. W003]UWQ22638.1 hydroxyacid dehydrogenase [Jannaschia sp. W003]